MAKTDSSMLARLERRYAVPPPPGPCRLCGDALTWEHTEGNQARWTCWPFVRADVDPGQPVKPGREAFDEHWRLSRVTMRAGDAEVMALVAAYKELIGLVAGAGRA